MVLLEFIQANLNEVNHFMLLVQKHSQLGFFILFKWIFYIRYENYKNIIE